MKNSIKRAQSQACLGFAERKNFRPLAKQLKKLSLTLALLITAATGAWADDTEPAVTIDNTKVTASFTMPASDVTVNYILARDLEDQTNKVTFSGLPTESTGGSIIVKKDDNGKYQPATPITLNDALISGDNKNIIADKGLTVKVEKKGDNSSWGNATPFAEFNDWQPGSTYRLTATPKDETSPYEGTVTSGEFTLVEQYDLTVKPADEYSKGKIENVTVGTETIVPNADGEATKTGIAPNTDVKIKAKRGYIIEKVEAGKTVQH